jgi:hypothetical protein
MKMPTEYFLLTFLLSTFSVTRASLHETIIQRVLPDKVIVGYPYWDYCDDAIIESVKNGVNVISWFSIDLAKHPQTNQPHIHRGPNTTCIATIAKQLRDLDLPTVHLVSVGGWNQPHPDTLFTPREWYETWKNWNKQVVAHPDLGFHGFDGIDWDLEGNDDMTSPINHFTAKEMAVIGEMSQYAKQDGFIVTMTPAESYFDHTTNNFSLSLSHNLPEWEILQPDFNYRGQNAYALLWSKYGKTYMADKKAVDTFDLVTIQIYEGFSHST